jgi:cobalt-zinc-cadmium efflux system outer membrane protein
MDHSRTKCCVRRGLAAGTVVLLVLTWGLEAGAQGPQVDIDNPPGAPDSRGKLGPAVGSSGTSGFDVIGVSTQPSLLGGRPGPSSTRVPINQLMQPQAPVSQISRIAVPEVLESASVPSYGDLEIPTQGEDLGPPDGLTLDGAIDLLIRNNLNLLALKYEIPMAEADVLTAGLRNNPIFYGDGQLVPYGHFSNNRPGGQTQYDVNVTFPLDVWRKRRRRMMVFEQAKKVTEAQFQDAVRLQIDNLYTAYVDVSAARLTLKYSQAYAVGIRRLLKLNEDLFQGGFIKPADVLALRAQLETAELQIRESGQTLGKTLHTLGLLLNMDYQQSEALRLRGGIYYENPLPTTREGLVETALATRPDLASFRLGLSRANADVGLALANRYSDVYLLYQPYTLQNNSPFGLKSAYSYAIGVTVSLPVFNRNQGNIARTKLNADQTKFELTNQERQVRYDVEEAVREFETSLISMIELKTQILPASRKVRDTAYERWKGGETSALDFLEAQKDYNEQVRKYRDAVVRHRQSMLDLNTAVGTRVLP